MKHGLIYFSLLASFLGFAQSTPETTLSKQELVVFEDDWVEAEFPGGVNALATFIKKNLLNPLKVKEDDCKVYVSFVVETDGSISNVKVERGCSPSLNEEALRLLELMPKWNPGMEGGKAVRTRCRLPIVFEAPKRKAMFSNSHK